MELKVVERSGPVARERSFARDVEKLELGAGDVFRGEAIVALAKAFLQSGVAYVGGYPGAPVSHLLDVLADARDGILAKLGVQLEASAGEAGAAALLGASIHYPLRGAVTWKSIVGTNVASDALSNLASAGVTGGALIVVGEDYGEGASVIQERTYAFAMKSTLPLIEPRCDLPHIVDLAEAAFELSEACRLPVLYSLRIRAAHMTGRFVCKDNLSPAHGLARARLAPTFERANVPLPPATYLQERVKFSERLPAARRFIRERGLNERIPGDGGRAGAIVAGGTYDTVVRGLALLGAVDAAGASRLPLLVLNVTYPLVPEEIVDFLADKDSVLIVEEGSPAYVEQQVRALAHEASLPARIFGKDVLPAAGEYDADVVRDGLARFIERTVDEPAAAEARRRAARIAAAADAARAAAPALPARPPGFCTGCPERPIFTALKLLRRERGEFHISSDIGCNTFSTQEPFNLGSTVLGYGLSLASAGAVGPALGQPAFAVMGDGGFWHNGIGTGAINAYWNGHDAVLVVLDNGYAAATGQQHVPSTGSTPWGRRAHVSIERALRGIGVRWIRRTDAYDLEASLRTLRAAYDARGPELRVVIADRECMLARQRRERPARAQAELRGQPRSVSCFGVDAEVCTGDHPCMLLNGCPSLTVCDERDPLKEGPAARVLASCVACGLCGQIAHAARLCPSFYRATRHANPTWPRRAFARIESALLRVLGAS